MGVAAHGGEAEGEEVKAGRGRLEGWLRPGAAVMGVPGDGPACGVF